MGVSFLLCAVASADLSSQVRPDSVRRDSAAAARDSLAARLERLEKDLELMRRQQADESRMATRTRSRIGVLLTARIQLNTFANSERMNNVDVPQFLLAPVATTNTQNTPGTRTLGMSLRQSRLGAAVSVDSVLGGWFEGDVDIDFFGGTSNGPGDRRTFPELRLRTARAQMHWKRTELLVGSETPLISDLSPISVAAVGLPGFVAAGNLWTWLPQIRLTRELVGSATSRFPLRFAVQGAVLAPFTNSTHATEPDGVDAGERSGRPYLQGRARVRWGALDDGSLSDGEMLSHGGEIGVSSHIGWARLSGTTLKQSKAIAADARFALPGGLEFRGEVYSGQLLRGLGGGAIAQTLGRPLEGETVGPILRDAAGWLQVNAQLSPIFIAGVGCGLDIVNLRDRPSRERNGNCAAHALLRPGQPLFIGFEVRGMQTRYAGRNFRGTHLNLVMGFEL